MQPGERIRKAQQPEGAGEEEERTGGDGGDRQDVEREVHPSPVVSGASIERDVPFLTKAIEANVASSASVNATSARAAWRVAAPVSSSAAMPPVPVRCGDLMRS